MVSRRKGTSTLRVPLGRAEYSQYVRVRGSDGRRNGPGYLGARIDPAGPIQRPTNDGDPWLDTSLSTNPVCVDVRRWQKVWSGGETGCMTPPGSVQTSLGPVRDGLARMILTKVAGPDPGAERSRVHDSPGPRWFGVERPIRQVHGDASMFAGGLRALLLQSLHPLAMAAVSAHSGYRGDPWGRLQRTSFFLAITTYGSVADADTAIERVRAVHERVRGKSPDGIPYQASDPHLLKWVHLAEVDSFLAAHQRYGAHPLDQAGRDGYVEDTALVAGKLGVLDPPTTEAELRAALESYRPELRGTKEAREAARFMLVHPPVPWVARPAYGLLTAAAVGLLPWWSRWPLRLPYLPLAERTVIRASGEALTRTIRWALTSPTLSVG